ncbi:polymorphic toxin-type HINT domain-containing protein [Sinomonas mesophila]|uniref:polymorphic toxin-type HINT domain-containing protein n=1 Tax=Sinomonas mesophila TaxID=1531955 RepID=UPI0009865574|nr:polymorphic toxin-type HINT domain-containing protein [Sinomonas mesophila]
MWKDVYTGNVLLRRVDPTGASTGYEYDTQLRLSATISADGTRTALAYSPAGDLKTFPGGTGTVRSEHNAAHLPTTTVNARGYTSTRGYDAADNLTQLTRPNPAGGTVDYSYVYDAAGNVTSATDPLGNVSTFQYSAEGDLTRATSPLGSVQSMAHDAAGRVTAVTSPRGNAAGADPAQFIWRYEYDALGRPTKATDPAGQYETVGYDADGRVTKATDTKGRATTYTYDDAGHLTTVQVPDPNVPPTTTAYDANGNTTTVTDSMGRTVSFQYDAANRVTSVTNPLGTYTFSYTARNQIATVTDPQDAVTAYKYDAAGRVVSSDQPGTDGDATYTYDANGNRTSMTDPNGTTTYAYDSLDRLTTVTRAGRTFALGYDAASNLTSLTSPDGAVTSYVYDADGRATQVKNGAAVVAEYTYDPDGNTLTVTRADGSTATKTYDSLGRLTRITDATAAATLLDEAYTYDPAGNPTSIARPDGTADTFAYDTLDRLTKACYILTETRNAQTTTHAFTYTRGGRTATATTPAGTTTYTYDGDGRRLSATLGTAKTTFEWDPFYRLANELDTNGALVRHYTHGDQPLTAHDAAGTPAYLHTDRLGSIRALTDATGAVTSAGAFEPYGRPRATGPNNPNAPPLGWLGQYQDPTGLTHLRARQYDPTAGMFLSTDPAASTSISSAYTYGTANPLRYLDITGLFSWDEFLVGVQDVSGIVSDVAGVLAIAAAVTGIGAPVAAALGTISVVAGAVHAGTKAIQAYNTCNSGKGACGDAVAEALMSAAAAVPGGRLVKGAASGLKSLSGASKAASTPAKACSFSGATVVLMADGARKSIENIKIGDKVIATDPETGEQEAKTVERVFVHDDTVIDLGVEGEPITTTEDHPFWSVTDQRFERADQLEPGEEVLGADGRTIRVSGLEVGTRRQALAYNLSVEGIHTYQVGQSEILVHNTCWARPETLEDHFRRHGGDFDAVSANDYAGMASDFFGRAGAEGLPTKVDVDGTIRIYDPDSNTFGSFTSEGKAKTLLKPTSPSYWERQPGVFQ